MIHTVFSAASRLGLERVVWASSETTLGLPFKSVRLALEAEIEEAESFVIAAADTVMKRPSRDLMAEIFPGVPVDEKVQGTDTLLDISKARTELGYSPEFSWRTLF